MHDSYCPKSSGCEIGVAREYYRGHESDVLSRTHSAMRTGKELTLKINGRKEEVLVDNGGQYYSLEKKVEGLYLIKFHAEEGAETIILSERTGQKLLTGLLVLFSPDKIFFAASSFDVDAGYTGNSLDIYDTNSLQRLYTMTKFPGDGGAYCLRWNAKDSLSYSVVTLEQLESNSLPTGSWRKLRYEKGKWGPEP